MPADDKQFLDKLRATIERLHPMAFDATATKILEVAPQLSLEAAQAYIDQAGDGQTVYFYGPGTISRFAVPRYGIAARDGQSAIFLAGVRFLAAPTPKCDNDLLVMEGVDDDYEAVKAAQLLGLRLYGDLLISAPYASTVHFVIRGPKFVKVLYGVLGSDWEAMQNGLRDYPFCEVLDISLQGLTQHGCEATQLDARGQHVHFAFTSCCGGWIVHEHCSVCHVKIPGAFGHTDVAMPATVVRFLSEECGHKFQRDPRVARVRQMQAWSNEITLADVRDDGEYHKPLRNIVMES